GTHVGDRCAIGQAELAEARPGELYKPTDDAALAQDLGDRKHQVGRRRAFGQLTMETKAHDLGSELLTVAFASSEKPNRVNSSRGDTVRFANPCSSVIAETICCFASSDEATFAASRNAIARRMLPACGVVLKSERRKSRIQ